MVAERVSDQLARLCAEAAAELRDPVIATALLEQADQLQQPLRLAVAGSVSAGKSTLVNGLLGRCVAPVEAGECTRIVTWYEHGEDGKVTIQLKDGTAQHTTLDEHGRVPERLGVPIEAVLRLVVSLDQPGLRELVLIDTPGINTVSQLTEAAARELLFGETAGANAQALLYVMRHLQVPDAAAVAEFRELFSKCGVSAVNAVAVLTQVDRRTNAVDIWPTARRLADSARRALSGMVLDVVPVVGLLAEASRAELLSEPDLEALRNIAGLDEESVDDLLDSVEDYLDPQLPGPDLGQRRRLLSRLHFYGQRQAVAALRERPDLDLPGLNQVLERAAGLKPREAGAGTEEDDRRASAAGSFSLDDVMAHFSRRADGLKAFAALGEVRRICRMPASPENRAVLARLEDTLDEGRPIPAGLSGLRLLVALEAVSRGDVTLDDDLVDELYQLVRGGTPAQQLGLPSDCGSEEVTQRAREMSIRWRSLSGQLGSTVAASRISDVLAVIEELAAVREAETPEVPVQLADPGHPPVPVGDVAGELLSELGAPQGGAPVESAADLILELRTGRTLEEQVGRLPSDAQELVATAAAERAAQVRRLANITTDGSRRRRLLDVCELLEHIWAQASGMPDLTGIG